MATECQPAAQAISIADPAVIECPYAAYARLRQAAPVYFDPVARFYVLTRYEDIRRALLQPDVYVSDDWMDLMRTGVHAERARKARDRFTKEGSVPGPSIGVLPPERHGPVRAVFNNAFRATRIREHEGFIRETAYRMVADFAQNGEADFVAQFATPFPMRVITTLAGIPAADAPDVKQWTEAWISRLGMMLLEEEEDRAVGLEIEFQRYAKGIIDRLRARPDGSILSDIVNVPAPDGSYLADAELFTHLNADLIVAGSETTTNALSAGVMILCKNSSVRERLRAEPDASLRLFIEEVLRLEGPVQGLFRIAARDIELHGVTIPKGSLIQLRYGSANRDPDQFAAPDQLDLDRGGAHLAFGAGAHHCAGAPLARAELYWGFRAILDGLDDIQLTPANDFKHLQSIIHRGLKELRISFTPRQAS
jgi:cytochrome P450